jgi:hypothetical protein
MLTSNPLWAVILVVLADALGFFPTFRKSFNKPYEETAFTFFLIAAGYAIGMFAFETYSVTTLLYPAYLLLANGAFWLYLLVRRAQVKNI